MSTTQQRRNDAGTLKQKNTKRNHNLFTKTYAVGVEGCNAFTNKHISQSYMTKTAGSEIFDRSPKNESALAGANRLVKDRSRKSGAIQERCLTELAPYYLALSRRQAGIVFGGLRLFVCLLFYLLKILRENGSSSRRETLSVDEQRRARMMQLNCQVAAPSSGARGVICCAWHRSFVLF